MSISTYAELKTAVANWLHRSNLTSRIPEFISMAEDQIQFDIMEKGGIRAMEAATDLTINAQTISLPTRFIGVRRLYLDSSASKKLEYFPPDRFWTSALALTTGRPRIFTIEGENISFAYSPDTTYTGKLLYFQRFAALSADADTNWLLTNARGLLLYGALIEAKAYAKDHPDALVWATKYDELLDSVIKANKRDRYPSGQLTSRSYVPVT